MSALNRHIIFKLLAVNLVLIAFVVAVVWVSIDTLAAGYFTTLMEKYHISPEPAHAMFVDAVHRYLVWASLTAVGLAVLLSYLMLRRILSPLTRMTQSTRDIAAGEFKSRVTVDSEDEVGQLAGAFNRMAQSLENMENLRRHLMIDVAHELRTPLTNMRGYLEALNDDVLPPSPETLQLLQEETLRIVQLVEDVLQQARADASHGQLNKVEMDLSVLVNDAVNIHSNVIKKKNLSVNIRSAQAPFNVMADAHRMDRVLRNLTDNATRYAPDNSSILIEITREKDQAKVAFVNQAEKILEDDLLFLFERFYRGEKSRSREHGGAGIGLSIVKELVAAHGGSVGANMTDDGFLEIWFTLPAI